MTVIRAIKIIDWMIKSEKNLAQTIEDPSRTWNQDFEYMQELAKSVAELQRTDAQNLEIVRKELVPKYHHLLYSV